MFYWWMSRLINCLNGFDEMVKINISDNEQIGQIISLVKERLENEGKYTIEEHKLIAKRELIERGYNDEKIDEWLEFIE